VIRYLSCTHNNGEKRLTKQELKLFKAGNGVIVTENNQTRFEECRECNSSTVNLRNYKNEVEE